MVRKSQFFGVKIGLKPGVYTEWADCKAQIMGVKDARWKRFDTAEEAKLYCSSSANTSYSSSNASSSG